MSEKMYKNMYRYLKCENYCSRAILLEFGYTFTLLDLYK